MTIAVYGTLKKSQRNHHILGKNPKFICETKTKPEYKLYLYGSYPILAEGGNTAVTVEVYEISSEQDIQNINTLEGFIKEGHPQNYYDRKKVILENGIEAFIFYMKGMENSNLEIIENGIF